jgi:hypothetical protein
MSEVTGHHGAGSVHQVSADQAIEWLTALETELGRRGWWVTLDATQRVARLCIHNPAASGMEGASVVAAQCCDGTWWFWWPWAERIGRTDQPVIAADLIAQTLGAAVQRREPPADQRPPAAAVASHLTQGYRA